MQFGKMEDFTIDQFAGSMALILGSVASLLLVIWKSRCECDLNCCFLFRCHRKPPPDKEGSDEENPSDKDKKKPKQIKPPSIQPPEESQPDPDILP